MYVKIETNGATDILINIPHENSPTALPAIASMLSNNAVFVRKGWREMQTVKPVMSILLDNEIILDGGDSGEIVIKTNESNYVLDESFAPISQDVLISFAKTYKKQDDAYQTIYKKSQYQEESIKDKDNEIQRLREEIDTLKADRDKP